jgi:hypothetical protein
MNCSVCVKGPVSATPLVGCEPPQPPDAVQASALVVVHVSVEASPDATVVGFAERLIVGTEGGGDGDGSATAAVDDPPPPPPQAARRRRSAAAFTLREVNVRIEFFKCLLLENISWSTDQC